GFAWVNALPAGPDLSPPEVPDRGAAGPVVGTRRTLVGQLVKVDTPAGADSSQYFVVRDDGLSPLTPVGAALLLNDPVTATAYPGQPVQSLTLDPAALAAVPRSRETSINPSHPATAPLPARVLAGEVPCIQLSLDAGAGVAPQVGLGAAPVSDGPAAAP